MRVSKGTYSLHCFHPSLVVMAKAPPPASAAKPKAAGTPGRSKKPAGEADDVDGQEQEQKPAKEAVPMVQVTAKSLNVR